MLTPFIIWNINDFYKIALHVVEMIIGSKRVTFWNFSESIKKFWSSVFRLELSSEFWILGILFGKLTKNELSFIRKYFLFWDNFRSVMGPVLKWISST